MKEEVQFYIHNTLIFGTFKKAKNMGKNPAVVLLHGYSSFRDELTGFAELAEKLSYNGISSLRIDMRGCGKSPKRGELYPFPEWIEDALAAVTYLEMRKDVHRERIGIIGMSMGGGTAIYAAALDKRIKAVVALAPVGDGEAWLKNLWVSYKGEKAWNTFVSKVLEDQKNEVLTGKSQWVHISEVLAFEKTANSSHAAIMKMYPQFLEEVPLSSAYSCFKFRPLDIVHKISPRPLRIIHSNEDESVPVEQAKLLYANTGEIKDLILINDSPHCFWIGPKSQEVQSKTVEWMVKYL